MKDETVHHHHVAHSHATGHGLVGHEQQRGGEARREDEVLPKVEQVRVRVRARARARARVRARARARARVRVRAPAQS